MTAQGRRLALGLRERRGSVALEFIMAAAVLVTLLGCALSLIGYVLESARLERTASNLANLVTLLPDPATPVTQQNPHPYVRLTDPQALGLQLLTLAVSRLANSQYQVYLTSVQMDPVSNTMTGIRLYADGALGGIPSTVPSAVCPSVSPNSNGDLICNSAPVLPNNYIMEPGEHILTVEVTWSVNLLGSQMLFGSTNQSTTRLAHFQDACVLTNSC